MSLVKFDEQSMSLQQAIEKALDLIHFQFNPKVQKIAIKLNLCYYWDYSTGETTNPKFVSARSSATSRCALSQLPYEARMKSYALLEVIIYVKTNGKKSDQKTTATI